MIILHTGDWHFEEAKHRNAGPGGINEGWFDIARAFDELVARALELRAAGEHVAIAFGGDLSQGRRPTAQTYAHVAQGIRKLEHQGVITIATPGNHDISSNDEANALQPLDSLEGFHLVNEPAIVWLQANAVSGRVSVVGPGGVNAPPTAAIVAVPFITRSQASAQLPADTDPDELLEAMGAAITAIIRGLVAEARAAQPSVPIFLMYHGTVTGATTNDGTPAHLFREPLVSSIDIAQLDLAGAMYSHIHKRQEISGINPLATPQAYCSSLERLHFGDEHDTKGWAEWTLPAAGDICAQLRWHDTNAREFLTIELDGNGIAFDPNTGALPGRQDFAGAIIKVKTTAAELERSGMTEREIRKLLLAAGAHSVPEIIVDRETVDVQHQAADLARTDPMIALAEYLADEHPDQDQEWHVQHLELAAGVIAGDAQAAYEMVWADRRPPALIDTPEPLNADNLEQTLETIHAIAEADAPF